MNRISIILCLCFLPWLAHAAPDNSFTSWRPTPQTLQASAAKKSVFVNEFGVRYWYSTGNIHYDVEKPRISYLNYDADSEHAGEAYARFSNRNESFFVKGIVGLGGKLDGDILDEDFTGSTKISSTNSKIDTGHLHYAQADMGFLINPLSNKTHTFTTNAIGGYGYFEDEMTARGIRCNQASVFGCTGPGDDLGFAADTKVLKNNATWNAVRIGIENTFRPSRYWQLRTEVVGIPYADFQNDDSHYLRSIGGGKLPNFRDSGTGYGAQLQATLDINITPRWTVNAGARYWRFWSSETDTDVGNPTVVATEKSYNWDHERYGFLLGAAYKF